MTGVQNTNFSNKEEIHDCSEFLKNSIQKFRVNIIKVTTAITCSIKMKRAN